jgi:hypothetical protein
MAPADPYYEEYNDFVVTHQAWPELHVKLLGPDADQVVQALREYMDAFVECIAMDNEFVVLKEEWGQACVPNTDTVRTYAYYEEYDRRERAFQYASLTEEIKMDELQALVNKRLL